MIPLSLLGSLIVEFELDDYDHCFTTGSGILNNWEIQRPVILCDVIQVDPSLSNSFAQHLLSGKELPISYQNFFSFVTTVDPSSYVTVPIYRGFSRLAAIYISFVQNGVPYNTNFICPLNDAPSTTANDLFRIYIQQGSTRNPLYATESISEVWYRNRLAAQITDGTESFGLTYQQFINSSFYTAFSLEKAAGEAVHTGTNTMGSMLYINMQGLSQYCNSVHVVCTFDSVAAITSGGVEFKF
jgi:hypothetical protein